VSKQQQQQQMLQQKLLLQVLPSSTGHVPSYRHAVQCSIKQGASQQCSGSESSRVCRCQAGQAVSTLKGCRSSCLAAAAAAVVAADGKLGRLLPCSDSM
jgi:hypothetical protein